MLKTTKQYNMYKADCQMYSRLDISYWLRQILLPQYKTARQLDRHITPFYATNCNNQLKAHRGLSNTHTIFAHQEQQHFSIYKSFEVIDIQYTRNLWITLNKESLSEYIFLFWAIL